MNKHNVKLLKDYNDIKLNPLENVNVWLNENNLLECYCLIHNLTDDEYLNGEYIFKIILSKNHPFNPPDFYFLTPNGRFEINKKLCFSNSSYHLESWSPMWNLKTIILGFLSFFLEQKSNGIGHINSDNLIKKKFAIESKCYNETNYNNILVNLSK